MDELKAKLQKLVNFALAHYWFGPVVASIAGIIVIIVASLCFGKYHNPVEKEVAKLIEKQTGVDVDAMLPADEAILNSISQESHDCPADVLKTLAEEPATCPAN
jgi:hypothetical protein